MATTIEKRNGLKQAIIMAKSTGYPILCTSLDRLGRDRDLLVREVLQQGVRVITVDSGRELTADEFVAAAEEAQREGKRIAADTRAGLKGSAHRSPGARKGGKVRGAVLKEQALDGAIEALEKMAEIELKAGRKLGHTEIAKVLSTLGVPLPPSVRKHKGTSNWTKSHVFRLRQRGFGFIDEAPRSSDAPPGYHD